MAKGVTFAPDALLEKAESILESPTPRDDPNNDMFENLGGGINFINMDMK